jgi:hypothetical protein
MSFARFRYETQLMGKKVILTPILVMVGFALFSLLLSYLKVSPGRFLLAGIEMILPIAVGVVVGNVALQDPALELQLTMPRQYDRTAIQRLLLILGWTTCIALLSSLVLSLLNLAYMPAILKTWVPLAAFLTMQLAWLAPLFWCAGIGLCIALLTGSWTGSSAMLGGIWLVEIIFKDYIVLTPWLRPLLLFPTTLLLFPIPGISQADFDRYWLNTRFEVLATGLVLLLIGWLLLRNTEGLLKGASAE